MSSVRNLFCGWMRTLALPAYLARNKFMAETTIGIVLLAAGASTRMNNQSKQLLQFEGQSLLRRAAQTVLASASQKTVVVLGANAEKLKSEIEDLPIQIVINENWMSGMASSIKTGLSALLEENQNLAAVVVLLCDQPLVTAQTINSLIDTFKQTKNLIVASEYNETIGVPALFAREIFNELLNLKADSGAKFVIKKQAASVKKILVPEAAFDVDTLADYERLLQQ